MGRPRARSKDRAEYEAAAWRFKGVRPDRVSPNLHLGLRDYPLALQRLERAVDARTATVIFAWSNPMWNELADHPRFKALQERIGLWS